MNYKYRRVYILVPFSESLNNHLFLSRFIAVCNHVCVHIVNKINKMYPFWAESTPDDEYWTTYEWFFVLWQIKNCYELAIKRGEEIGKIPETNKEQMTEEYLRQADEYWGNILKEHKKSGNKNKG